MRSDFLERFSEPGEQSPPSLQLLFRDPLTLDEPDLKTALAAIGNASAQVDLIDVAEYPLAGTLVSPNGPPAKCVGIVEWGEHCVRLAGFDAPMPYGPVQTCVGPAMIAPPLKQDALNHASHVLLYYAGTDPDPLERFVALGLVASALARFDAVVVIHEDARTAVQALDLIPDPGEDIAETLRTLPIPLLWGGFVKVDVGDPDRPWVRTFANPRLGLPDLAYKLSGHAQTARVFEIFSGMLGYLRSLGESFVAGDTVDLGDGTHFRFRSPTQDEWFLESEGIMLVLEHLEC